MSHGAGPPPSNPRDLRFWRISILSTALSLLCGIIAFGLLVKKPAHFFDVFYFFDILYSSTHLLLLHMPQDELKGASGWALVFFYLARLFAVAAVAFTALALVLEILGREIKLWRTARTGRHAVICGLGPV